MWVIKLLIKIDVLEKIQDKNLQPRFISSITPHGNEIYMRHIQLLLLYFKYMSSIFQI